ncbi:uncharacterized protein BEWA_052620 [Theileria equi strain WA]|uniref:Membrane protein, putative n=1 Tax=Theileria equi strain WA TaxID=1537102 RepID=L1LCP6_THEEQ|nr:uncharacterized protein BEWA_052620 [Theileria equi strain WA]EKX73207.1 membrane protein, putative [Theileria equi strain WA]|eukprot:XP_004832659.1 uncharacterized protein BEWA_052620 [Theileria equi strain WA]
MNLMSLKTLLVGLLGIWTLFVFAGAYTLQAEGVDDEQYTHTRGFPADEPSTDVNYNSLESSVDPDQANGPKVTRICGQVFGLQDREKLEALVTLNFGMRVAHIDKFGGYCFFNIPVGRYIISIVHKNHDFLDVLIRIREIKGKLYIYQTYHHIHVKPNEVFFNKLYHKPYISPRHNEQYNAWRLFFKPYVFLTLLFIFTLSLPKTISYRNYNNIKVGEKIVDHFKDQLSKKRKLSHEDYINGLKYSYLLSKYSYFRGNKKEGDNDDQESEDSSSIDSVDSVESLEHNTEEYAKFNYDSIKKSDFTSPFLNSLLKAAKFWGTGYNWTRSTRIFDY